MGKTKGKAAAQEAPQVEESAYIAEVESSVEDIGPDKARRMLGDQRHNRYLSLPYADRLAGAMERGEWRVNGESIKTDTFDRPFDGQHRLEAIIRSGVIIRSVVVRGLDPNVVETIDMGRRRTLSDILRLREEENASRLASGLYLYWRYLNGRLENRSMRGRDYPTPQQCVDLLEERPYIRDGGVISSRLYTHIRLSPSIGMTAFALLSDADADDTERFLESVAEDRELPSNDPRTVFRRQVEQEWAEQARTHTRPWRERELAWMIKAWNAWRQGETLTTIRWVPGGSSGERFPRPL